MHLSHVLMQFYLSAEQHSDVFWRMCVLTQSLSDCGYQIRDITTIEKNVILKNLSNLLSSWISTNLELRQSTIKGQLVLECIELLASRITDMLFNDADSQIQKDVKILQFFFQRVFKNCTGEKIQKRLAPIKWRLFSAVTAVHACAFDGLMS